ncbi:MAG: T9SS type A sorting domain-containing protein [Bacteroidales bacterium]|nr:T9SS type A sorting domain-containing protein [Bacteroidales bacterium]MCF8458928.1 T9SS type A sorting domain-containing protein [Bacteroidales bacterium]
MKKLFILSYFICFVAFSSNAYWFEINGIITDNNGNPVPSHEVYIYSLDMVDPAIVTTSPGGHYHLQLWVSGFYFPEIYVYTWAYCDNEWTNFVEHFTAFNGTFQVDLQICHHTSVPSECTADFQTEQISSHYYGFLNTSLGEVDSLRWYFGQGQSSSKDSVVILFNDNGLHDVYLQIWAGGNCSDSTVVTIPVGDWDFIDGNVSMNNIDLPDGSVYVYQLTGTINESIWTTKVHIENGSFDVPYLFFDDYYLQAVPEFDLSGSYFPKYLPTYFGGSKSWETAQTLNLFTTPSPVQINLASYNEMYYGPGSISGTIERFDSIKGAGSNFYLTDNIRPPISLFLINENDEYIDAKVFEYSNPFQFNDLPLGDYTLRVEKFAEPSFEIPISLTELEPKKENLEIQIHLFFMAVGIDPTKDSQNGVEIYPNPSSERVYIDFNANEFESIKLFDSWGQLLFESKNVQSGNFSVDISTYASGLYTIILMRKDGLFITEKIQKIE